MKRLVLALTLVMSTMLTGCESTKYYDFQMLKYYEVSSNSAGTTDVRFYMEGNLCSVSSDNLTYITEYRKYQVSPKIYKTLPVAYDTVISTYKGKSNFKCYYIGEDGEKYRVRSNGIKEVN